MNVAQMRMRRNGQRFQRPQGTQAEQTAAILASLDHSKTRRAGGGGVDAHYAIGLCSHSN